MLSDSVAQPTDRRKYTPLKPRDIDRYSAILRSGRWFRALPEALQSQLLTAGVLRDLAAGERLFSRGDPPSGMFAVLEGGVRITATASNGKEALLTFVEPPSWFGEIAVFDREPRTHDAIAETSALLVHVSHADLDRILTAEPRYWRDLALLLTVKLRLLFNAVEDLAVSPLAVRLARRLLWMAHGYGERQDHTLRVVEIGQEQLALMLSASRQSINQLLKELESRGVLQIAYGQIEIVDLAALQRAAQINE